MEQVGRAFVFDYGQFAVKVHYLSDSKLRWEQVKGPGVGLKAEETYHFVRVRPNAYFISWQEKDTSVVTQVVDFERRKVYTTWVSPEKMVEHVQGDIEPVPSGPVTDSQEGGAAT